MTLPPRSAPIPGPGEGRHQDHVRLRGPPQPGGQEDQLVPQLSRVPQSPRTSILQPPTSMDLPSLYCALSDSHTVHTSVLAGALGVLGVRGDMFFVLHHMNIFGILGPLFFLAGIYWFTE